jgi:hypothetical protein
MIYRIIALQSLRLQKNRAIKKRIKYATNSRRKTKREWTTPNKHHRSRCESPLVQGVVVEISYIQAAVDNKHNLVVATHHKS